MKDNLIQQKSYEFAIRIVRLYRYMVEIKHETILSKQILRSGTSIGANVEEAIGGQSTKDFLAKMSIAYKEARETHYWIRLLRDTGFLKAKQTESMLSDLEVILKIIAKIQITTKNSISNS